jgi:signal transduction histidine kinase
MASIVKGIRQALGADPRILVLYNFDPHDAPPDVDDVIRAEPFEPGELVMRVGSLLRDQAERRVLQKKTNELLGLYRMSWEFSLAGGAEALFGHIARHSAEMLKAQRGLVLLFDAERRQLVAQPPGFGFSPDQVKHVRYSVDGEPRSRWNFRKNGPLLSNKAPADTRLMPQLVSELGIQSLMVVPITRGPLILGLLAVADRTEGSPFADEDLNLLLALAGQATIAVENLRLHDEIKKANELLQEYDRLKSEFVGIVAHDFRRPLMAIRGFAELVLEEAELPLESRQEFMRTVISETDHLAQLANDTLLITQIETGQLSFNFREVDLGPFILESVPLGMSEHSVLMDVPQDFPKIWADPDRLRQVVTNLVTNAAKYSPEGGSITVRCRERGPQHVGIAVIDHGLGVPPEQVAKLFQKFARVRSDGHMKISGTGLGLYICRLIVEGHGGQIWVESEFGKGSTFAIALPHDARTARPGAGSGAKEAEAEAATVQPSPNPPAPKVFSDEDVPDTAEPTPTEGGHSPPGVDSPTGKSGGAKSDRASNKARGSQKVPGQDGHDRVAPADGAPAQELTGPGHRRRRGGLAAEARPVYDGLGVEDLPVAHRRHEAAGLPDGPHRPVVAGRVPDPDCGGHRLRLDPVPLAESGLEAAVEGVRPGGLDRGDAGHPAYEAEFVGLAQRLAEGGGVSEGAGGNDDPVRGIPAALLEQLPDDRLLALDPPGVDGVEEGDAEGVGGVADQPQAGVEVATDEEGGRPVGQGLGQLARGDLVRGDEHEGGQAGLGRVGGHGGRRVPGGGAGHGARPGPDGLGGGHGHAPVLERARGVLALVLERQVVQAHPPGDRLPPVHGGVSLRMGDERAPPGQEQLAVAPDPASLDRGVSRAPPPLEAGAER